MTKQEFIFFLENLKQDLKDNHHSWENKTLEDFFDAMSRYTEDIDGYYINTNQEIDLDKVDFKVFSDILNGAKIYE